MGSPVGWVGFSLHTVDQVLIFIVTPQENNPGMDGLPGRRLVEICGKLARTLLAGKKKKGELL